MFKMAKESGAAEVMEGSSSSGGASASAAFTGSAFRLGSDEQQSEHVPSKV